MPKNPRTPPGPLTALPADFLNHTGPLWRIYTTVGRYRQAWNQMRTAGPLAGMRWDPHPTAPAPRTASVAYTGVDVATAFGEVFQQRRRITLSNTKALVSWTPTRPLRLLNLAVAPAGEVAWALRNGASASLDSADKRTCCTWAAQIAATWPDLDGIHVRSTITGAPMVVLFTPAADSYPTLPAFSRNLNDPAIAAVIEHTADRLGWPIAEA